MTLLIQVNIEHLGVFQGSQNGGDGFFLSIGKGDAIKTHAEFRRAMHVTGIADHGDVPVQQTSRRQSDFSLDENGLQNFGDDGIVDVVDLRVNP